MLIFNPSLLGVPGVLGRSPGRTRRHPSQLTPRVSSPQKPRRRRSPSSFAPLPRRRGGAEQPCLPGRRRKWANLNSASRWMGPCRVGVRQLSARRGRSRSGPGTSARRLVRTWPGGTKEGPGHGRPGGRTRCGLLCALHAAHWRSCSPELP